MSGIQVVIQEIVKGNDIIKNIFVDNLERTHSYQRLLMAVVEVDRNIPVIDTGHIGIEYSGGKFCISFFSGKPVKEGGITIDVPAPNKVVINGIDKQKVGQFAANVRGKRPPEPYKGKGIKYATETIRHKEGKAGGKK